MSDKISNIVTALYTFFSGFGLPAYPEDTVPDEASLPYITYEIAVPPIWTAAQLHAHIYYRSSSYAAISAKAGEIYNTIKDGDAVIQFENGSLHIGVDDDVDFLQFMQMQGDPNLKNAYLTMVMQTVSE